MLPFLVLATWRLSFLPGTSLNIPSFPRLILCVARTIFRACHYIIISAVCGIFRGICGSIQSFWAVARTRRGISHCGQFLPRQLPSIQELPSCQYLHPLVSFHIQLSFPLPSRQCSQYHPVRFLHLARFEIYACGYLGSTANPPVASFSGRKRGEGDLGHDNYAMSQLLWSF